LGQLISALSKQKAKRCRAKLRESFSDLPNYPQSLKEQFKCEKIVGEMDPAAFAATYYHALPSLAAGLRYPYPATTAAAGASATGRGMIFYPQPMTVEPQERPEEAKSPE
jgi:hypothetical protein